MSSVLEQLRQQVNQAVEETGVDLTVAVKGGGGPRLLPEGYTLAVLVGYVEYGMQPQEFQGNKRDPALNYHLEFALFSPGYANEDGTPYIIRTWPSAISNNERSRSFKLFKSLNWKGTAKAFPQLIGEAFLLCIKNVPRSKSDQTIVSRVDLEKFQPPIDALSRAPYPVPEVPDDAYRLFLWSHPTLEGWESLKIDGTNDDGTSRDFVRNEILGALDFQGSALQALLSGNSIALPDPSSLAAPAEVAAQAPLAQATAPVVQAAPVVAPAVAAPSVAPVNPVESPATVAAPAVAAPVVAATPVVAPVGVAPVAPTAAQPTVAPSNPVLPA